MSDLAYDLQDVTKAYDLGDRKLTILKGLTLQIRSGDYVAITGPSGSGKSTLMHLLGCLDTPTSGQLRIDGQIVGKLSDDECAILRRKTIGFVFQQFHLLPYYSANENVSLALSYSGHPDRATRADQLLKKLGLGHRLDHRPRALSGGEQQRVAIARAVANAPKILLADEPTGALDQANGRMILDLMDEFHNQGKTIILVTHDLDVAAHAARVVHMVDGEINRDERKR